MKKLIVVLGVLISLGVGVWRFYLSAIWYYDSDGSTLWKNTMTLKEKKSIWPYVTKYAVHWNGLSMSVGSDQQMEQVYSAKWVDFLLWNGHGIEKIEIIGINSGKLLYPSKKDVPLYDSPGIKMMMGQTTTHNGRYIIARVTVPAEEKALHIVVTDVLGNITEDTVEIESIPHPGEDNEKVNNKEKGKINI